MKLRLMLIAAIAMIMTLSMGTSRADALCAHVKLVGINTPVMCFQMP